MAESFTRRKIKRNYLFSGQTKCYTYHKKYLESTNHGKSFRWIDIQHLIIDICTEDWWRKVVMDIVGDQARSKKHFFILCSKTSGILPWKECFVVSMLFPEILYNCLNSSFVHNARHICNQNHTWISHDTTIDVDWDWLPLPIIF